MLKQNYMPHLIIIIILFLSACGQTGPLYLPSEEDPVLPKTEATQRQQQLEQQDSLGE